MANVCENCGKGAITGRQHKHKKGVAAKRWRNRVAHTKKVFKPNLQSATIKGKKMTLCTKCLRTLKKKALKE
jgi:ribosomal protein L28